jgi:hypothetical protein
VNAGGVAVPVTRPEDGVVEFDTMAGERYVLTRSGA